MIAGTNAATHSGFDMLDIGLREKGRRAVGQWPAYDAYDAFLTRLQRRLEETTDAAERSRLERFRDGAIALGREVVAELIADVIRRGGS